METNNIKVSVICTAYNHEKLIRSALDGFVMQKTNFAYEVLIHDDASTDKTADIIREYAEKYPDIIVPVLQTENQYSKKVKIINTFLLPKARGQYFAYCEGDDFWTDPNKLQRQVDFLDAHPDYVACVHNSVVRDCSGQEPDRLFVVLKDEHEITLNETIKGMIYAYQTSALVMRREYQDNMPGFFNVASSYGFGDWPRAIWLSYKGRIHFFPEAMSTYRLMSNPDSWSSSTFTVKRRLRQYEGEVAMLEAAKADLPEQYHAQLEHEALRRRFGMLELQERYSELRKPPYDVIWKEIAMGHKLKISVKKYLPWLYHRMKRIKD